MDSSYPGIEFAADGVCNCCADAMRRRQFEWRAGPEGEAELNRFSQNLKAERRNKEYDALIGLSGGTDSAFLAHLAVRVLKLRVLALHVDGGWNSEAAVRNIETIVKRLNLDLCTHVIEWSEMRDLQLAFLRSGVQNQYIPQDHAFFSSLIRTARKYEISTFLSGVNFASESVIPTGWGHPSMDGKHVREIHRIFGREPLEKYPLMTLKEFVLLTRALRAVNVYRPLNFIPYDKGRAAALLRSEYGWREYGGKHSESRFTKFYQDTYLPKRFGFDKRRLHFSSLIVAGQMTRDDALSQLTTSAIQPAEQRRDIRFVSKKLGISSDELRALIELPPASHRDFKNDLAFHRGLGSVRSLIRCASRRIRIR